MFLVVFLVWNHHHYIHVMAFECSNCGMYNRASIAEMALLRRTVFALKLSRLLFTVPTEFRVQIGSFTRFILEQVMSSISFDLRVEQRTVFAEDLLAFMTDSLCISVRISSKSPCLFYFLYTRRPCLTLALWSTFLLLQIRRQGQLRRANLTQFGGTCCVHSRDITGTLSSSSSSTPRIPFIKTGGS